MVNQATKRHKKGQLRSLCASLWLILDQAAFAFGAADGAGEDPEGEGKEDDEKGEEGEEGLGYLGEGVAFDEDLPDALEAVSWGKEKGDVAEGWAGVGFQELGWEKYSGEQRRARAEEDAEWITAFENHRETRGKNTQTREHHGRE